MQISIVKGAILDFLMFLSIFLIMAIVLRLSKQGLKPFGDMRQIAAMAHVEESIQRSVETGKSVHFTSGDGTFTGTESLAMMAGISVLGKVAEYCAKYNVPLRVTCRYPEIFNISRAVARAGYERAGVPEAFKEDTVVFTSPDYFAFNNSVAYYLLREKPAASFLIGYFLGGGVYVGEAGKRGGAIQIGGNHTFFVLCCDYFLLGEELYAAGAYASEDPEMLGSIAGQDIVKMIALAITFVGIVAMFFNSKFIYDLLSM